MYHNVEQLLDEALRQNVSIHEIIIQNEIMLTEYTRDEVYTKMGQRWAIMSQSVKSAINDTLADDGKNMIRGQSFKQNIYGMKASTLAGTTVNEIMAKAFSASEVNASMGCICAAPTAGACGIVPAVIDTVSRQQRSKQVDILNALFVASGFGAIITRNATVSGAEGGCQAECGVAAAMASAAAVFLGGGTNEMCAQAVSISLINCMGLICDPVAGLVQLPCSFRNASQSINALISADIALAGQICAIPADEVIEAMYRVGKKLPEDFRETGLGGIAATKTATKLANQYLN